MRFKIIIVICLFSLLSFQTSAALNHIKTSLILGNVAITGPIYPKLGEYANFSLFHYDYNGTLLLTGYYNITYQSSAVPLPGCFNVTRDLYLGGLISAWQTVNASNRLVVENSYNMWSGASYYEFWIPTSVGVGDNITWWTTPGANATVTGSQVLNLLNRTIDCWQVECLVNGVSPDPKDLNNTAYFDKSTGHCVEYVGYQTDGYFNISISTTDIVSQAFYPTIYIRADGSVDPLTAPIQRNGDIYTLIDDINCSSDGIAIERNNMTLDGLGHTILGHYSFPFTKGIDITLRSNVTIKNINIDNFDLGIWLNSSSYNSMVGNNIENIDVIGIGLYFSSNNNTIVENNIKNNDDGIVLDLDSNCNYICGNNITMNEDNGISMFESSSDSISGNNITANHNSGIYMGPYNYSINGNIIAYNNIGIESIDSSNSSLMGNNITNNVYGISFSSCSNNIVCGNNITNNEKGIYIWECSNNKIYHNSFTNNTEPVHIYSAPTNLWDDGYPSGGNYWSDYLSKYPNASEIDSSGIWNQSYVINENNTDRYPLMSQYTIPEYSLSLILHLFMLATLLAVIVYKRKRTKFPIEHRFMPWLNGKIQKSDLVI